MSSNKIIKRFGNCVAVIELEKKLDGFKLWLELEEAGLLSPSEALKYSKEIVDAAKWLRENEY